MISTAIADYLHEKSISPDWLCLKMGMEESRMAQVLAGEERFTVEEYVRICEALEVSYDYFYQRSRDMETV